MLSRRRHLFEIEDQPWVPAWFRGYMTDYLSALFNFFLARTPVAERLAGVIRESDRDVVLDLCSGSSGPMLGLVRALDEKLDLRPRVVLSDLYPNLRAYRELRRRSNGQVDFYPRPLDARRLAETDLSPELRRAVLTLFAGFHHFTPADARVILEQARDGGHPIAIFEVSERRWPTLLSLPLVATGVFLITPWLRPFSLRRWFFTYVLPLVPFAVFWDGVASCLRTYRTAELRDMTASLTNPDDDLPYRWQVGRAPVAGLPFVAVAWMTGVPRDEPGPADGDSTLDFLKPSKQNP